MTVENRSGMIGLNQCAVYDILFGNRFVIVNKRFYSVLLNKLLYFSVCFLIIALTWGMFAKI